MQQLTEVNVMTPATLQQWRELHDLMARVPTVDADTIGVFSDDECSGWRMVHVVARLEGGAWLRIIAEGADICTAVGKAHEVLRKLACADVQTSVNGSASAETAAHHIADMVRAKLAAQEAHQ